MAGIETRMTGLESEMRDLRAEVRDLRVEVREEITRLRVSLPIIASSPLASEDAIVTRHDPLLQILPGTRPDRAILDARMCAVFNARQHA